VLNADGRLRFTKKVCWPGFRLGEKAELYAQPFPAALEIVSMKHRFDRLRDVDALPWSFS
jgi:hypothetical protein